MMTIRPRQKKSLGFTLVELAIVLGVTGVLFVGLYRLLSGGNAQVRDSAVASQQQQLISAVKAYLSTTNGGNWMAAQLTANGTATTGGNITLTLPAAAPNGTDNGNCHNGYADPNLKTFCDVLPAGFSSGTTNAFGQAYNIQILASAFTAPATPNTYSFMIVTSGGDPIPDADGGRISSLIGVDGGFIYSSNICGAPTASTACGSYGAWSASTGATGYGFPFATASGHVASRSYSSPEVTGQVPWLARQPISGDTQLTGNTSPNYNTMQTDLFLGANNMWLNSGNATAPPFAFAKPSGIIHLQGGTMDLETGEINETISNGNALFLDAIGSPNGYLSQVAPNAATGPLATINSRCTNVTTGVNGIAYHANCQFALVIGGDVNVNGQLQAGTLYAGTFIYSSSDSRLKTDIQPLSHALDDVMKIKPVSFSFKANGEKGLGVIAQEIEKIYPQLVKQKDDGMKSVNYDGLIAPLIASVQELKEENKELQNQVKVQALRLDQFEQKSQHKSE